MKWFHVFVFQSISIYICLCEIVLDKDKLTKAFVDDLMKLSGQQSYEEPVLSRIEKIDNNEYYLEVKIKYVGQHNLTEQKYFQCSGIVTDRGGIVAARNTECTDFVKAGTGDTDLAADLSGIGTGYTVIGEGATLENKFQPSNITSSLVDMTASIAPEDVVRQLDRHESKDRHSLNQVHHVKTKAQVIENVNHDAIDMDYYFKLAEESLAQYSVSSETKAYYKPIEIIKVTTQPAAGTLTTIIFKASPTDCVVDSLGQATSSVCQIQNEGAVLHCLSSITKQPWARYKNITVSCSPVKFRQRRAIAGGMVEQDPNDPRYLVLVKNSMERIGASDYTVIKVIEVTNQVVSGELLRIVFTGSAKKCTVDSNNRPSSPICEVEKPNTETVCHLYVWDRPWLDKQDINVKCLANEHNQNNAQRCGTNILGKEYIEDSNDPKYFRLAEQALARYSISSKDKTYYKPIEITKVTTTHLDDVLFVVMGTLTRIYFTASATNCKVDYIGQPTSSVCEIQNTFELICNAGIRETPEIYHNPARRTISVDCYSPMPLRDIIEDPNDPKFFKLAEEALAEYSISSETKTFYKPIEISKVTTQRGVAILTKIIFKASPMDCEVDSLGQPTSSVCQIQNTVQLNCFSAILSKPWLGRKDTSVTYCSLPLGGSLLKNFIAGGELIQNPNEPKYFSLAKKSLKNYITSSGTSLHYEPDKILKVTTQVVSGFMTRIDFTAFATDSANTQNPESELTCHTSIWDQPWLDEEKIDITCSPHSVTRSKLIDTGLPGGQMTQNPADPKYLNLAAESLTKATTLFGKHYKPTKILLVTTQVVSGITTRIDFIASATNCFVDSNGRPISSICKVENTQNQVICHSEIWEQAWLNKKDIHISCRLLPHLALVK